MTPPATEDLADDPPRPADRDRGTEEVGSLRRALSARKVAVFGASETPGKMGHEVVRQLLEGGFEGELALINPRGGSLFGHALERDPFVAEGADVAVIASPKETVEGLLKQCASVAVPLAIVCAGGYREVGNIREERHLADTARDLGLLLLGPNCIGIFAADARLNLTTMPSLPTGHVSALIQSGGVTFQIAHRLARLSAGFDALVNLGNKAGIDFTDAMESIAERSGTSAILLYMESYDEGDRLLEALSRVSPRVPVVVMFGGATDAGSRSARSHTGAILTPWDRLAGVLEGHGAFVAHTLFEAVAAAAGSGVSTGPRRTDGRRIFVVSDGGGMATLASDALARAGFLLPQPGAELKDALNDIEGLGRALPANPLDFAGMADLNPGLFPLALRLAHDSGEFDGLLVAGALGSYQSLYGDAVGADELLAAEGIAELGRIGHLPLVTQSTVAADRPPAIRLISAGGVPCLEWPEEAAAALALRLRPRRTHEDTPAAVSAADRITSDPRQAQWDPVLASDTVDLVSALRDFSIPHGLGELVAREEVLTERGDRWVLRLDGFAHKSSVGAIRIVGSEERLDAFDELAALAQYHRAAQVIRLAPFIEHEHELLVTFWRGETTGRGWAIGTGGLRAELAGDVQTGAFPRSRADVFEVLRGTRIWSTILGIGVEADTVATIVLNLAEAFEQCLPHLTELEFNPIAITDADAVVLDALPIRTRMNQTDP